VSSSGQPPFETPGSGPREPDEDGEVDRGPRERKIHRLTNTGAPRRLDVFLSEELPEHSRAFLQRLIADGHVTVSPCSRDVKSALKVARGAIVRVEVPAPRKTDLTPQDIPIEVMYEDQHLAVIDKPAGLAVHPAPDQSTHTLVNALLFRLRDLSSIGGEERPGIVHRLDKETSGVLVVAKNDFAHRALSTQFKERIVRKTYLAIARGEPDAWEGHIDLPLGRSYTHTKKQMVRVDGSGREAVTDYRVLEKYKGYALIECYPHTGRTHQIRVHFASLRLPIACDKLYGRERRILLSDLRESGHEPDELPLMERHALHAAGITFQHPVTREELSFSSHLHADMHALLKALERFRSYR
jgi:23S rRNA pseudouridine1911/1915/1917 synthase